MRFQNVELEESGGPVGLERRDGRYVLQVPYGMGGMDSAQAMSLLYRCLVVFRQIDRKEHQVLSQRDGAETRENGLASAPLGLAFYDALGLDELFEKVDPHSLLSFCKRRGRSNEDPFRRLDQHLHRALFEQNGAIYLDSIQGPVTSGQVGKADIVGLYCFLALDFYRVFLNVDPRRVWGSFLIEGEALAAAFSHRYLSAQDSLYAGDSDSRHRCLLHLRHLLQCVDRRAAPRDAHYMQLHDALERYLHAGSDKASRNGLIWGVSNFWAMWESICLCHGMGEGQDRLERVRTCDYQHLPKGCASDAVQLRWRTHRTEVFARNHIKRRPDLVTQDDKVWTVVDFKYYRTTNLKRPDWHKDMGAKITKDERDFLNLEAYGLLLSNHLAKAGKGEHVVRLEMWLPGRTASCIESQGEPKWDPPLGLRVLPTVELMTAYAQLYPGIARV